MKIKTNAETQLKRVPMPGSERRGRSKSARTHQTWKGLDEQNCRINRSALETEKEHKRKNNHLHVLTYNLKYGIADLPQRSLLMEQLKTLHRFKYDIIGICETRARGEQRMVWKDTGDELIIGGGSGTHHVGGVGFTINKKIADKVIEVIIHSSRIATLKLDVGKKKPLLIVQVYALHIGHGIQEIESFYSELAHHLKQPASQKLVIGDFNAQVGTRPVNTRYVGNFTGRSWSEQLYMKIKPWSEGYVCDPPSIPQLISNIMFHVVA
ncbi:hypothetical protein Y032_0781g2309 [Ancylostoma ceylanicum]|uniref:Endonuclease/exonuclease/phosphatase domain-containing protein n=1 Tax=Ancylostoma ceylanicum TaxID=53326 RepID=A0A016WE78_9BILA|nr:hypothetical protein Y032_0781g2309 [Ancylostoma ceylanicum]